MWLVIVLTVTAYAPASGGINCDANCALTASGAPPAVGLAACPRNWPFGTRLYVPGYGPAVCADRGGSITGRRIDVVMATEREALAWGRRDLPVVMWGGEGGVATWWSRTRHRNARRSLRGGLREAAD